MCPGPMGEEVRCAYALGKSNMSPNCQWSHVRPALSVVSLVTELPRLISISRPDAWTCVVILSSAFRRHTLHHHHESAAWMRRRIGLSDLSCTQWTIFWQRAIWWLTIVILNPKPRLLLLLLLFLLLLLHFPEMSTTCITWRRYYQFFSATAITKYMSGVCPCKSVVWHV
jgi:hypothetical protein